LTAVTARIPILAGRCSVAEIHLAAAVAHRWATKGRHKDADVDADAALARLTLQQLTPKAGSTADATVAPAQPVVSVVIHDLACTVLFLPLGIAAQVRHPVPL